MSSLIEKRSPGLDLFGGIGDTGADGARYTAPQGYDDLSWTKGAHSLRMGFAVERIDQNINVGGLQPPTGTWTFGSIRNMLTAIPDQFSITQLPGSDNVRGLRTSIFAGYVQDDFRFRPNLTLNLGLRYETSTAIKEVNGKFGNLHNLTDTQPSTGNPLFQNPTERNFTPRVGLAWDPFRDGKTSLRAGFGIYDALPLPSLLWNKASGSVPFVQSGLLTSPPSSSFPNQAFQLLRPNNFQVSFVEYNPKRSYKMQWNFNIQRQLTKDFSLMVGYVGATSVHMPIQANTFNLVPPNLATRTADGHYLFPATGPIQIINPNFGRINSLWWPVHARYNSLQSSLTKRLSHGLTLQAVYTWSKSIDNGSSVLTSSETVNHLDPAYPFDMSINRGPSDFDVTHNGAINFLWAIPTGASRKGPAGLLLSGWQLGGIFTVQSGAPYNLRLGNDRARYGASTVSTSGFPEKPDFAAGPGCSNPNATNPGNPSHYTNIQCFSFPALGVLGNLGRNALRGPGLENFDFSLFKNHNLWHEKLAIQFRAEIFNLFNRANFQSARATVFDSQGNLVSTAAQIQPPTVTSSRQIQFGMKFLW